MGKTSGATRLFIEPIERRILLAVFAVDYSYHPLRPGGAPLPEYATATPVSKGRFILSEITRDEDGDDTITYSRVFSDGSPDNTFGKHGSLSFDEDDFNTYFTGSRFIVALEDGPSADMSVYTINGKPDESVGNGTGNFSIPFQQPTVYGWSVAVFELLHTYSDGGMLVSVLFSLPSGDDDSQLVKLHADGTADTSFGKNGVVIPPGSLGEVFVANDGIYVDLTQGTDDNEVLMHLTPNGKVDTTFGKKGFLGLSTDSGNTTNEKFEETSDGKIMFLEQHFDGSPLMVRRLNHDGTPDKSFGSAGSITVKVSADIAPIGDVVDQDAYYVDSQGRILVATGSTIFRYSSSGVLDSYPFNGTAQFDGFGISEDDQGRVLTLSTLQGQVDQRYALVPDVQLDSKGIAHIVGTTGNDTLTVDRISNDRYQFIVNGETTDLIAPKVKRIDIDLYNGDSNIDIDPSVEAPASIQADTGNDTIVTGNGPDTITTGIGSDSINCGDGNDSITLDDFDLDGQSFTKQSVKHHITGGTGNKTIEIDQGSDFITLGVGNNSITSLGAANHISIAGGSNHLDLQGSSSTVTIGGSGNNNISADEDGDEQITTGDGNDTISIDLASATTIHGGGGNDVITASDEPNTIYGEGGNDTIKAGAGNDYISGGSGNDSIDGGNGNNTLIGGEGNDVLKGGTGDDYLSGQAGSDSLTGGGGTDTLVSG